MREHFHREGENYWKQLPAEFGGAKLLVDTHGRSGPEPDWKLVADFEAFLLHEGAALRSRVHEPLKGLAAQTGWFADDELATAYFDWVEILLLHDASALAAESGAGPVYELHFSMEPFGHAWVDTYGTWVATFEKLALIGLRRKQR